jgi:hypothetical protein
MAKRLARRASAVAHYVWVIGAGALAALTAGCSGSVAQDSLTPLRMDAGETPGSESAPAADACAPNGNLVGPTPQSPGSPPNATCSTTGRVICTLPPGVTIPALPTPDSGPIMPPGLQTIAGLSPSAVVAQAGVGAPPVPLGGAVAPGEYQLVAVTVYGQIPPNVVGSPNPGDSIGAMLNVSCDTYNIVYGVASDDGLGQFGGNGCGRLVPFTIPLAGLVGFVDAGDIWNDWMPYSATPEAVTLIQTLPYEDYGRGLIEGSYTVVEEFVPVGATAPASAAVNSGCTQPSSSAPAARDPRCPSVPPAGSAPCDPHPAPLECEYGGDAYGRCTTIAICALAPDGTFEFVLPPAATDTPCANSPGCPPDFASASAAQGGADGGLCSGGVQSPCEYPEGTCGCGGSSSASDWACTPREVTDGGCPVSRPLSGDGCPVEDLTCYYGTPCGAGTYEGPPAVCSGGYWEQFVAEYSCPAILSP